MPIVSEIMKIVDERETQKTKPEKSKSEQWKSEI